MNLSLDSLWGLPLEPAPIRRVEIVQAKAKPKQARTWPTLLDYLDTEFAFKSEQKEVAALIEENTALLVDLLKKHYSADIEIAIQFGDVSSEDRYISAIGAAYPYLYRSTLKWLRDKPNYKLNTYLGMALLGWHKAVRQKWHRESKCPWSNTANETEPADAAQADELEEYLPATLTNSERHVLLLIGRGYNLAEVMETCKTRDKNKVRRIIRSAKLKIREAAGEQS